MGLRINHNISAINSHRNLQKNNADLAKSLERLSSGLKINRASDGPASLVISEQMRAQITGLDQAVKNSETAVSMIQTTEGALNEVNKLMLNMRQLAVHASNEGVNDAVMLAADQQEILNSLENIDRIAQNTQFGRVKILDGSNGVNGIASGDGVEYVSATTKTMGSNQGGYSVKIKQNATRSTMLATSPLTDELVKSGESFKILENGKTASYTTKAKDNVATTVQNLQSAINAASIEVDVSVDDKGILKLQHREYGAGNKFSASTRNAPILSNVANQFADSVDGKDIVGFINGESTDGVGQILTGLNGADNVDGLAIRVTTQADLRDRNLNGNLLAADGQTLVRERNKIYSIDSRQEETLLEMPNADGNLAIALDEEGNEIMVNVSELSDMDDFLDAFDDNRRDGLLKEDQNYVSSVGNVRVAQNSVQFQVGANEGQTVAISLINARSDALGKGVQNTSKYESLGDIDVTSFQGAQDTINLLDASIDEVSSVRAKLGAFQKNTLESNLVNLRVGQESLIASESVLRDVDMASEMAAFTRNKIMAQSATAMLSHANKMPSSILSLIQ